MIKAHKIRLHPTTEQANYFARARLDQPLCVELGADGMGSTVSSGRETYRVQTQEAVQRDQAGALPLDLGSDQECF